MASATFEDHPTDPDKVILRKKPYLDKGRDYEEGFVDGMQHQMQSSVDKAVNRLAQPEQEPVALQYSQKDIDWQQEQQIKAQASTPPQSTDEEEYLSKAYRLANELRCHLAIAPAPQRTWVGLTDKEIDAGLLRTNYAMQTAGAWRDGVEWAQSQLKEKNNG